MVLGADLAAAAAHTVCATARTLSLRLSTLDGPPLDFFYCTVMDGINKHALMLNRFKG